MQIIIDTSTWTQEQKNYLQAAAVTLLFRAGINSEGISVKGNVIDIPNLVADVSSILTTSKLKAFITTELEKSRVATEEALIETQAREQELELSEFRDIKLADIDVKINAIENLGELKTALKKFVRFVMARQ